MIGAPAVGVSGGMNDDVSVSDVVSFPQGFSAHVAAVGLRDGGNDVAVIVADRPARCAAMFTRSRFAGSSVNLSRSRAANGSSQAVVIVAKNANVATGPEGAANAAEVTELVSRSFGLLDDDVLICSTGVIGRQYPMPAFRQYFGISRLEALNASPLDVAVAMMTTDTRPKVAERVIGGARVVGIAKGVGMLEPDMATMLAFVLTDAEVNTTVLDRVWRSAVNDTLNCLSVDTDTSTSDTAVVLASGEAGPVDEDVFDSALREVLLDLTLQLARDGEGATKLLTVTVTGARDRDQAKRVAKVVLNSPLVKTAVHGADPNWGRVAMAIGKCSDDEDIEPERVSITFGDLCLYPQLPDAEPDLERLREIMRATDVHVTVDLGISDSDGPARCTVYGCDLSAQYVRINADYTT